MPFQSKKQQKYLFAKKPKVAEKFAEETPKKAYKSLPEKKGKSKNPSADYLRDPDGLMKISKKHRRK